MQPNQLQQAQHQFKHWRSHKSVGECIPNHLWNLVHALILSQAYKPSAIGRELGISSGQLKKKFPNHYPSRATKTVPVVAASSGGTVDTSSTSLVNARRANFVEAPLETVLPTASQTIPTLTLQKPNGTKLTFDSGSKELMSHVLTQFMMEN